MTAEKAIVLYADDRTNTARTDWIARLIRDLRERHGIDADHWDVAVQPGEDLTRFMEQATAHSAWLLLVCTPDYKVRFDDRTGGVGYEARLVAARLVADGPGRIIPLLREGDDASSIPQALRGIRRMDFREGVNQQEMAARLADGLLGRWATPATLGCRADEKLVWVLNSHPNREAFRWEERGFGDGVAPPDDVACVPEDIWQSRRAARWRRDGWLREVPEPPWATTGIRLYRHEHPDQPYITAFRLHDPPVPLRFRDVVELSELDMKLPENAHLRRHWVPREPDIAGPFASRFRQIETDQDPMWIDAVPRGYEPCVNFGLSWCEPVSPERAAEVLQQVALLRRPGATPAPYRAPKKRDPLASLVSTLTSLKDELGLSVVRLGDLKKYLRGHNLELDDGEVLALVETIRLARLHCPDPRERFPSEALPSEVVVVRLPEPPPPAT